MSELSRELVREALVVYAEPLIEFYDQSEMEKRHLRALIAVAQAWLDGVPFDTGDTE